jgi:tetratricopeptide (TPR) repeat protein
VAFFTISPAAWAQDFEFQPEAVEKSGPPSKTLQKALKLYESQDYYSASIELHKVIEGETGDSEANRQRAEFWMGKTLYHLGFYSAALSYFDRIVQKGEGHRYHAATLKWLASLSRKLPESAGILKKIGKYDRVQLEQAALEKVRDELFYLLGRFHYTQGNFKEAIGLFASVPPASPFYARAKFMEGITNVRLYQAKPAAKAFKDLLRAAREAPKTNEISTFEELAILSMARVFYSVKQFKLSIKYYDMIEPESPHWLQALFEQSWAYFQINDFSKALGNIHTINAPYFENHFFPESYILRAVIYFQNCLYPQSKEAITEFNVKYPPLRKELKDALKRNKDPADFYDYALAVMKERAGLSEGAGRLARTSLGDKMIQKTFHYVTELDRELRQVKNADPAWKATAIAGVVLQDLTLQKSLAQNEAGQMAQRRIKRVVKEIQELIKQGIKVEYETINGLKNKLEASLRNEQIVTAARRDQTHIVPDEEHLFWPFDGQYWRDELGYYKFRIKSVCAR